MPKRAKSKKKAEPVISPQEQRAREEIKSLARATKAQRRVKSLARSLESAMKGSSAGLMALASTIAARAGYTLVQTSEQV